MSMTNFCCCCDLRRGCVVFAWLQMMYLVMTMTTVIGYSDFFILLTARFHNNTQYYSGFDFLEAFATNIIKGILFIKIVTCVSLIWGVIKECHLFYQPWLFISGIDVCISSLSVLIFFILGCTLSSAFFLAFFIYGALTALNWYFWMCVYTVYKKDMKPSMLSFEMGYDQYTNAATEM